MMRRQQQQQEQERQHDYQSKMLYEVSALVLNMMRSIDISDESPNNRSQQQQITPSGFASLLLGISLALMLCGSVTFFIGFILMPWVIGFVVFLYFVGLVSSISMIGKAILCCCCNSPPPPTPSKDVPSWKLL